MTPSHESFRAALAAAIDRWGDREAVVSREDGRVRTYAQLGGCVAAAAARIRQASPGATGLLIATSRPDQIVVPYLAGLVLGRRVAVAASGGRDETLAILRVLGEDAVMITSPDEIGTTPAGCSRVLPAWSIWDSGPCGDEALGVDEGAGAADSDRASRAEVVFFTSGTTGLSKGVLIRWGALVGNALEVAEAFGFGHERHLLLLSPAHTNGQVISLLAPLFSGGAVVVGRQSGLVALFGLWADVHRLRLDVVDCVPTVISSLLELSDSLPPAAPRPRLFITGGASISPAVIERFETRFNVPLLQEYGLSEAVCVSSCERPGDRRRGSVGKPIGATEVAVVDARGESCPANVRGRVTIRTPHRLDGYVEDGATVLDPAPDGVLKTEDLGYFDDQGFLFVVGRRDDTLIKGGYNIVPDDVERSLRELPGVAGCVAFGVPCPVYGQDLVVAIVPAANPPPDLREVSDHLKSRGGRVWVPRELVYIDNIPATVSGKPLRRVLLANYLSARQGDSA